MKTTTTTAMWFSVLMLCVSSEALAAWGVESIDPEPSVVTVDVNNDISGITTTIAVQISGGVYTINPYNSPDWIELTAHDSGGGDVLTVLRDGSVALSVEVDPDGNVIQCIGGPAATGIEADITAFLAAFAETWSYATRAVAIQSVGMNFINTGMCGAP